MPRTSGADWTDDELILALNTYQENIHQELNKNHPAIMQLSDILRKAPINISWLRNESYRPPDGVRSRLGNFRRLESGGVTNIPNSTISIWEKYRNKPVELQTKKEKILASWNAKRHIVPSGDIPFITGKEYKRSYLHDLWGGSRQSGISPSAQQNVIFIFTGESGEQHGYSDRWIDGIFKYVGEGQRGDMELKSGNSAIHTHVQDGRDLLLFKQERRGHVTFQGQVVCAGYSATRGKDTEGNQRKILIFDLVPCTEFDTEEAQIVEAEVRRIGDLDQLRELALRSANMKLPPKERKVFNYRRSAAVKLYALKRASGDCEACAVKAPFETAQGKPYLEVHHINKLSDGGPDHPDHVIALCPNCHRKAHYSREAEEFNNELKSVVSHIEKQF
ncbi:MAG: HNH endonuclease [Oceanospirillaceae bacterium]|nr:HNH endonuclease [Oceanospirillaceae bacterium]